MRRLPLLVACLVLAAGPAHGQGPTGDAGVDAALLDRARAAIADGRLDEADRILGAARREMVNRDDIDFLRGALALARNDHDAAIAAFRAVLARDPSLNRVRLELARSLFLAGDDQAASHHFRIVQAADLPPEVRRKVEAFQEEIRRRRRWSADLSLGLAPDTNLNAGTSARTVDLYGIPFTLDDEARRTTGVGVAVSLGGGYQAPVSENARLTVGGRLGTVDYGGGRFDDTALSAYVGPRFLVAPGAEVTMTATAARRWYGNDAYLATAGGRVEAQTVLTPTLLLAVSASLQQVDYDRVDALDGTVATVTVGLTLGLDAVSLARLDLALSREQAREDPFRNIQAFLGLSYYRELGEGFSVTLGGSAAAARYDEPLAAFGVTRHDTVLTGRMSVSNRRIDLWGFTPVLSYTRTDRDSNIGLYGYGRDRVELTLTRAF